MEQVPHLERPAPRAATTTSPIQDTSSHCHGHTAQRCRCYGSRERCGVEQRLRSNMSGGPVRSDALPARGDYLMEHLGGSRGPCEPKRRRLPEEDIKSAPPM
jgi:hypothetical protein